MLNWLGIMVSCGLTDLYADMLRAFEFDFAES